MVVGFERIGIEFEGPWDPEAFGFLTSSRAVYGYYVVIIWLLYGYYMVIIWLLYGHYMVII
jgi:hypothetical protein